MTRQHLNLVREGEQAMVNRLNDLLGVASREVGAAYAAGKEGVAGDQEGLIWEVEAGAALGVAGSVQDDSGETGDADRQVVA